MRRQIRRSCQTPQPFLLAATTAALGAYTFLANPAAARGHEQRCDLNKDGYEDLIVGTPSEGFPPYSGQAGMVDIFPGGPGGIEYWRGLEIARGTRYLGGKPLSGGSFGYAIACADFDGDGFTDLAVGAPSFFADPGRPNGLVFVFPSAPKGGEIDFRPPIELRPHVGSKAVFEAFGIGLDTGDLDGDGNIDLVINARGMVYVAWGTKHGLNPAVAGTAYLGEQHKDRPQWGAATAVGDFNGDGFDDLVFGPEYKSDDLNERPTILPGDSRGFPYGPDRANQIELKGVTAADLPSYGDGSLEQTGLHSQTALMRPIFGLTTDFNGDGFDDLAMRTGRSGLLAIFLGTPQGLRDKADELLHYEHLPGNRVHEWNDDLEDALDWPATLAEEGLFVFERSTAAVLEIRTYDVIAWPTD